MKKLIKVLVVMAVCFGIVGCGNKKFSNRYLSLEEVQEYLEDSGYRFYIFYNDYKTVGLTNDTVLISLTAPNNRIMYKNKELNNSIIDVTYEYEGEDEEEEEQYESYMAWLDENGLEHDQIEEVLDKYIRENSEYYNSEPTTPTLSTKFIAGGYDYYDGNYAKDEEINGSKMHKLFYLKDGLHYFSIGDEAGNSTTYFFGENYAGEQTCKYDFGTNSVREGATCSSEELQDVKGVKEIFESEIQKLGITIVELKSNN